MRLLLVLLLGAFSLAVSGCADQTYIGENGFFSFAITDETPPFVVVEESALFIAEQRVLLPLREPTGAELGELGSGAEGLPWARRPWVTRGDYEIEIDWVAINLEDEAVEVAITINGINEFQEYFPGFAVDEEEVIPEFAQWERAIVLEPLERQFGTVREEQLDEVAVDLATVVNGVTNANAIVHPDSNSAIDPRAVPFVPTTIPALAGIRAGLRVTGEEGGTPPNVVLELTVRVRDEANKIVALDSAWMMPDPAPFMPSSIVPPEE